ncbi:MAG TPA: respiratory nitrate reductase subunit gamma [Spirochaetia bacterium]|nr:respiratory nitrate reductase subunit gamma [Spirochaetia bacterium]
MAYYFIGSILPYIALVVFTIGVLYRLGRWVGARIVHRIVLPPFSSTPTDVVVNIGAEAVFFRSMFRMDKKLWIGAWVFHVALFLVLSGHLVGIYTLGREFVYIGASVSLSTYLSDLLGLSSGLLIMLALLYLLYRRVTINEVRVISSTSDYLHLFLLLGIVVVGDIMRVFPATGIDYAPVRAWVTGIIMGAPVAMPQVPLFAVHMLLVQILLMVFPFSKLMHSLGMFANRWILHKMYLEPAPGMPGITAPAGEAYKPDFGSQAINGGVS